MDQGCDLADRLIARDPTVVFWQDTARNCLSLKAELAAVAGSPADALAQATQVRNSVRADRAIRARDGFALSEAQKLVGDILWRSGDRAGAMAAWKAGLAAWPRGMAETPSQMAMRGEMLRGVGQRREGAQLASRLAAMGYRQSLSNRVKI